MAKKRYSPRPADVLGDPVIRREKSVPQYAIHGQAKTPVGPNPLQALGRALTGFNPALAQYAQNQQEKASLEAEGFYGQMMEGVTDNSVKVKKILRDAGFKQWANPYVYKNQLGNMGANQAYRDAAALTANPEFSAALHELSKTSDNFLLDAQGLAENWKDKLYTREAEDKKSQTYWNMGYASKWLTARSNMLAPFVAQSSKWQQGKIRADFYESGQNILRNAIFSKDKNGNPVGNLKPLRRFVSDQFGGFPDDEIGYNKAIWEQIVKPVFTQLAIDPDNEIILAKAYEKVKKLTRDTGSGRTQVFKQLRIEMDTFYADLENTMQRAESTQNTRDKTRRGDLLLKVTDTLKDWNSGSVLAQYDPEGVAYEVRGVQWPFTPTEALAVTNFLYKQPEFRVSWKDTEVEQKRIFQSISSTAMTAVARANQQKYATQDEENKAMLESWGKEVAVDPLFADLFGAYRDDIYKAVGDIDLSRADSVKAALEKFSADELEKLWYEQHHEMAPGTVPLLAAMKGVLSQKGDVYSVERATDLMHIAQAAIRDGKVTDELLQELQDAQVEVIDPQTDKELKALYDTGLATKGLGKWMKLGEEMASNKDIWKELGVRAEDIKAIYDYEKKRGTGMVAEISVPTEEERYAANETKLWLDDQIARIWRDEVSRAMGRLPHTARDDEWESGLKDKVKKNVIERIGGLTRAFHKFHNEALNSHEADTLSDVKALTMMLDQKDQDQVGIYNHLEDRFEEAVTGVPVIGDPTPGVPGDLSVAYKNHAEDFFTGVAGTAHWNNLYDLKDKSAKRSAFLLGEMHKAFLAMRTAESTGAINTATLRTEYKSAQDKFKGHALAFGIHDWRDWQTDNKDDMKLSVSMKGEDLDIPLSIRNDHINMASVLVFPNLEGMEDVANMFETWEGGDPTAWLNRDDAPEELQRFAKFFAKAHGVDLLNPDPAQRKKDEPRIGKLWERQATMMITRHPDRMPQKLFKALEYRQIDNYIDRKDEKGNEWTTYQGTDFSINDKRWVKGMRMQNREMLSGKHTLEKGFSTKDLMKNVLALTGGTVADKPYDIEGGELEEDFSDLPLAGRVMGFLGDALQESVLNEYPVLEWLIPDEDKTKHWKRISEFLRIEESVSRSYDMVSETYMSKNSHLAFRGKREVLAQELAMASNGISNPTKYSRTPVFTIGTSADQRAAIKRDTKRILGLLKEGERKKVPELAVLYNTLIARFGSDKEYFIAPSSSGIRRTANVWGLVAIPVPSVPLDTAASKKAALVNKDVWPWSRPDDALLEKPKEEPELSLSEKAAGLVKTPSGPTQRIPLTPPDNKTFMEGKKPRSTGRGKEEYVVTKDDADFTTIARKFGVTAEALMRTNPAVNPSQFSVGQVLEIPAKPPKSDAKKREEAMPNLAKEYKLEEEHEKAVEKFKTEEVPKILKSIQDKNINKLMDEVLERMKERDFKEAKLKYIKALEDGVKSGKLQPIKAEEAVKRYEELQKQSKNKR